MPDKAHEAANQAPSNQETDSEGRRKAQIRLRIHHNNSGAFPLLQCRLPGRRSLAAPAAATHPSVPACPLSRAVRGDCFLRIPSRALERFPMSRLRRQRSGYARHAVIPDVLVQGKGKESSVSAKELEGAGQSAAIFLDRYARLIPR